MKRVLLSGVTVLGILVTVLSTTGIPLPNLSYEVECEGEIVNVDVSPGVRIQDFNLVFALEVVTDSKPQILTCATKIMRAQVDGRKLRDHKVENIQITGEDSLKIRAFVRWYQNRNLHDGKTIDVNSSITPHQQGVVIHYSADIRNVPPWFQDLVVDKGDSRGERIIYLSDFNRFSDWITIRSIRLVEGSSFSAHVTLSLSMFRNPEPS